MSAPPTLSVLTVAALLLGTAFQVAAEPPCPQRDLHALGYRDGSQGLDASRFLAHQSACGTAAVDLDAAVYRRGWEEGIARYCAPENAFDLGSAGASYRNVCPQPLRRLFHEGFYAGRRLYHAQTEIAELQEILAHRTQALAEISRALAAAEAHLVRADATSIERAQWVRETKSLAREQRDLEADIDALEREIHTQQEDLDLLRTSLADAR
jgi:DNA-binding transcriptional MerR regulator